MPLSYIELQQVASLSRRRHGFDSRTGRQTPQQFHDPCGCLAADAFLNGLVWTCVGRNTREKRAHNLVLRLPVSFFTTCASSPQDPSSKAVMERRGALSIPFLVEIQTPILDLQTFVNCRRLPQSSGGNMTPQVCSRRSTTIGNTTL